MFNLLSLDEFHIILHFARVLLVQLSDALHTFAQREQERREVPVLIGERHELPLEVHVLNCQLRQPVEMGVEVLRRAERINCDVPEAVAPTIPAIVIDNAFWIPVDSAFAGRHIPLHPAVRRNITYRHVNK